MRISFWDIDDNGTEPFYETELAVDAHVPQPGDTLRFNESRWKVSGRTFRMFDGDNDFDIWIYMYREELSKSVREKVKARFRI